MIPSPSAASHADTSAIVSVRTRAPRGRGALGAALGRVARAGDRISLIGPLGAGKTQLAKGIAVGLGIGEVVNSPSFTLMAEYRGRLPLFHQDLYRLSGASRGHRERSARRAAGHGVTITEWGDRLDPTLDAGRLEIRFAVLTDQERALSFVTADADRYAAYLAAAVERDTWEATGGG